MKVYYINLDRSPERRTWFKQQAEALGLELVRVSAVDGRQLSVAELDRWRAFSEGNEILSAAEIGCFLSHRKAWEMVLSGDEKWAFVAEDDIHFSGNAAAFLSDDKWIPPLAGLVKAETDLRRHEFSSSSWAAPSGHELRQLKSTHLGSGGYFLTREAAAHLLAYTKARCEAVDGLLFAKKYMQEHQLGVLQLLPSICIQDCYVNEHSSASSLYSIIDKERIENRLQAKKRTMTPLSKMAREFRRIAMKASQFIPRIYLTVTGRSVFLTVGSVEIQTSYKDNI